MLDKVTSVHGDNHPELYEVKKHFSDLGNELLSHLHKEEALLFPVIRKLEARQIDPAALPFGTVANPIRVMVAEHDAAGEDMGAIRRLTRDYRDGGAKAPEFIPGMKRPLISTYAHGTITL